jgi:hypothetical protein
MGLAERQLLLFSACLYQRTKMRKKMIDPGAYLQSVVKPPYITINQLLSKVIYLLFSQWIVQTGVRMVHLGLSHVLLFEILYHLLQEISMKCHHTSHY